jgi:hypothetical protein
MPLPYSHAPIAASRLPAYSLCSEETPMWVGRNTLLHLCFGLAVCAVLPFSALAQQEDLQSQQDSSVAAAARRAREEKKKPTKPSKVITDDDLASTLKPGGVNVGGPPDSDAEPPNSKAVAKPEAADAAGSKPDASKSGDDPEIAALKDQMGAVEKELDLLKRELALDSDAYYSKPNYSNDPNGKAKLDGEEQQVSNKQQQLDDLKARLTALQQQNKSESSQASPDESAKGANPTAPSNPPQP